jgi:hypothetical protein
MKMNEMDREFLIEILIMKMNYSRIFFEKMSIKELELYYLDSLEETSL